VIPACDGSQKTEFLWREKEIKFLSKIRNSERLRSLKTSKKLINNNFIFFIY